MSQNVYEAMFLLDANRYTKDPGGISGQVVTLVEKCAGEILASRLWNEQKLAYSIRGHRKGAYWLMYFRMDGGQLAKLRRECKLNDNVLRCMFLIVDPRLVGTLVAHAGGESAVEEDSAEPAAVAEGDSAEPAAVAEGDSAEPAAVAEGDAPEPVAVGGATDESTEKEGG